MSYATFWLLDWICCTAWDQQLLRKSYRLLSYPLTLSDVRDGITIFLWCYLTPRLIFRTVQDTKLLRKSYVLLSYPQDFITRKQLNYRSLIMLYHSSIKFVAMCCYLNPRLYQIYTIEVQECYDAISHLDWICGTVLGQQSSQEALCVPIITLDFIRCTRLNYRSLMMLYLSSTKFVALLEDSKHLRKSYMALSYPRLY